MVEGSDSTAKNLLLYACCLHLRNKQRGGKCTTASAPPWPRYSASYAMRGGGTYVVNAHYAASSRAQTRCFKGHRLLKIQCAFCHSARMIPKPRPRTQAKKSPYFHTFHTRMVQAVGWGEPSRRAATAHPEGSPHLRAARWSAPTAVGRDHRARRIHAYRDLETTRTTVKNNIVLRAHLEHSESWQFEDRQMGAGELARAPKTSCFKQVVSNFQKAPLKFQKLKLTAISAVPSAGAGTVNIS